MRKTIVAILLFLGALPVVAETLAEAQKTVASATAAQKTAWLAALSQEAADKPARVNKSACSVGYSPTVYAGKPNPWPGDVPLPNDQLLAAYITRYGQPPGSGGSRVGYCCELFGLNYEALENAAKAGARGPGGEVLHAGCASTVEATDASFQIPRGAPYIGTWVAALRDGGSPANPIVTHDGAKLCGSSVDPHGMFGSYPVFFSNQPPCLSAQAPTISSVTPASGPTAGGTAITINGTNFQPGITAQLGGINLPVNYVGTGALKAVSPAAAAGAVALRLVNPDSQAAVLQNAFTFVSGNPQCKMITIILGTRGDTVLRVTDTEVACP